MSIFIPSHITGFFNIVDNKNFLKKGSCGGGFLLNKGVVTSIKHTNKDETSILINGENNKNFEVIVNEVLKLIDIDENFKISQEIQVPVGCGFGTSASQALGITYELLKDDLIKAGQIAHLAEVNLGTGLGDVIAETGKGLVLRTKSGAPGYGEIESFKYNELYVGCKVLGKLSTNSIINNEESRKLISKEGLNSFNKFIKDKSINNFLKLSFEFSNKSKLISPEMIKIVNKLKENREILGSSMAMLGKCVFAFSYEKNAFPEDFTIYKLNNEGIK